MSTTYITMKGLDGLDYLMKTGKLSDMKAGLASWKARIIWDIMQEQQPERFSQLAAERTLVPFLNQICAPYYQQMEQHLQKGLNETEANEIEWPLLVASAGL